jgi:hypothetical protein
MTHYTYIYFRQDGTPYYVGKGSGRRAFKNGGRPCNRPQSRARILVQHWESEEKAFEIEQWYILLYGRQDIDSGILRNKSDGGEGTSNLSEETRMRMSSSHLGSMHSEETKEKIRRSHIGISLGNKYHLGKKHSEETKKKMRAAAKKRWEICHGRNR